MRTYELACIFKVTEDSAALKDKVNALVKDIQGQVLSADDWGNRRLAYPIKKEREGYYYILKFSADPLKVNEIKKILQLTESVIRFMILQDVHVHQFKKDEKETKPSTLRKRPDFPPRHRERRPEREMTDR